MGEQDNFLGLNLVLIGMVILAIFGYLIMLMRKRWRHNFLHFGRRKKKEEKP